MLSITRPKRSDAALTAYQIDDFRIDVQAREIRRKGEAIPLEPKAFDLLIYLIDNRERAVPREELIDRVWAGRVVSDGVVTQAIAKLRKLFGGEPEGTVRTIHRVGYRFVAELRPVVEEQDTTSSIARWGIALGVFLFLATGLFLRSWLSPDEQPAAHSPVRIAVAPLEGRSMAAELSSKLIGDALRGRLAEVKGLSVRSLDFTDAVYKPSDPVQSAIDIDVQWLLGGTIEPVESGPNHRLTLSLWNAASARKFHIGVFNIPKLVDVTATAQLVELREDIAELVVKRMPNHLVLGASASDLPATMADFEAYTIYQERLDQEDCDPALVEALVPLVERTPRFKEALQALAYAYYNRFWACGAAPVELERAVATADQLLAIFPGHVEGVNVKALALASGGHVSEALRAIDDAMIENPDSAILWAIRANTLTYVGELDEALASMNRALVLDPLVLAAETGGSPNVFQYTGNWGDYLEHQPSTDAAYFSFQRAYALYRLGDAVAAQEVLEPALRRRPSDLYARYGAALNAAIEGRFDSAQAVLNGIVEQRDQLLHADGEVAYREAVLFALARNPEGAIRRLWKAVEQGFVCIRCVTSDALWAPLLEAGELDAWLTFARQQRSQLVDS